MNENDIIGLLGLFNYLVNERDSSIHQRNSEDPINLNLQGIEIFKKSDLLLKNKNQEYKWSETTRIKFHYISNRDGSLRWVFPAAFSSYLFLDFYSTTSLKSKIYAFVIKLFCSLRLCRIVSSGSFSLNPTRPQVGDYIKKINFAAFMGSPGAGKKINLLRSRDDGSRSFTKIPLNPVARFRVANEKSSLQCLSNYRIKNLIIPEVISSTKAGLEISEIAPLHKNRSLELGEKHLLFIDSLSEKTLKSTLWKKSTLKQILKTRLNQIKNNSTYRANPSFLKQLNQTFDSIRNNQAIISSKAHGDFTPWNIYVSKQNLFVYDWELCGNSFPLLYDLFHFEFQKGILIERKSSEEIMISIHQKMTLFFQKNRSLKKEIDEKLYLNLYVLSVATYYLCEFNQQKTIHAQAKWMVNTWSKALSELSKSPEKIDSRKSFLKDFQNHLADYDYGLLKFHCTSLDELPLESDLDIICQYSTAKEIVEFSTNHLFVAKIINTSRSHMTSLLICFRDDSILAIDIIFDIIRKNIRLLPLSEVLKKTDQYNCGLKTVAPQIENRFIELFYLLNGSETACSKTGKKEKDQSFNNISTRRKRALKELKKERFNSKIDRFILSIKYIYDCLKMLLFNKGFSLTFSGVDGAGKSTIITELKARLEKTYRKRVVVLRHRPSFLPIISAWKHGKKEAEKRSVASLPRHGKNSSKTSSILRFSYYYVDYLLGQFYVYLRYILPGYIVLYDRYYFDFVVDSKRSNILINPSLPLIGYKLILKPRFNFFLYASPDIILKRKKELTRSTIQDLSRKYIDLFTDLSKKSFLPNQYRCVENINKASTLDSITCLLHNYILNTKS